MIYLTEVGIDHIGEEHPMLKGQESLILEAIRRPELVVAGSSGELIAIRKTGSGRKLAVAYREQGDHGFVITAFLFKGSRYYEEKRKLWPLT